MDSNLAFILTRSYWPQYHYMLPWDYQTGEFGNYAKGCTTTFIRVWAAMGWATGLRTMDTSSIKNALVTATETNKPAIECLCDAENYSKQYNETEQFLKQSKTF
jgi:stearoyl-CoA desaturase (delta-9 desaturase)